MDAYAEVLKSQVPLMATSRDSAMDALANALALSSDFKAGNYNLPALHAELEKLVTTASESNYNLRGLRSSIGRLPRMTSDLNRAKRAIVGQLDLLMSEVDKTVQNVRNIQDSLERMK